MVHGRVFPPNWRNTNMGRRWPAPRPRDVKQSRATLLPCRDNRLERKASPSRNLALPDHPNGAGRSGPQGRLFYFALGGAAYTHGASCLFRFSGESGAGVTRPHGAGGVPIGRGLGAG